MWFDEDEAVAEELIANWDECSQYYKEKKRTLTFSEFNRYGIASTYMIEQIVPPFGVLDFEPLNFLTNFYFQSRKGKAFVI